MHNERPIRRNMVSTVGLYHTWTLPKIIIMGEVWIFRPLLVHFCTAVHKWVKDHNVKRSLYLLSHDGFFSNSKNGLCQFAFIPSASSSHFKKNRSVGNIDPLRLKWYPFSHTKYMMLPDSCISSPTVTAFENPSSSNTLVIFSHRLARKNQSMMLECDK